MSPLWCGTNFIVRNVTRNPISSNSIKQNKTIGILGGMGPEATALFYQEIIYQCQKQYGAQYDRDFPEIFIYSLPIPDIVNGIKDPEKIMPFLVKGIRKLEYAGADFIVMPCNTIHYFFDEMKKYSSIPMLNIIEEVAKKAKSTNCRKIGLLATATTIDNKLYDKILEKYGIGLIIPKQQERVTEIILNILAGKKLESDKEALKILVAEMKELGADAIVLGCTDIPILLKQEDVDIVLLDTIKTLAESTVKYAIGDIE
ncbi:MAG: amino acid racemase [Candidatus Aenigmatarchaeota archaeon]